MTHLIAISPVIANLLLSLRALPLKGVAIWSPSFPCHCGENRNPPSTSLPPLSRHSHFPRHCGEKPAPDLPRTGSGAGIHLPRHSHPSFVIPISPVIAVKNLPRTGSGAAIHLDNLIIQVPPCRINLLNQLKLPFSLPFLNRLLACDSALH